MASTTDPIGSGRGGNLSRRDRAGARDPHTAAAALMVVGATSGAGKSTVVTALCRALRRRGWAVVPFKAQNMSTHTVRTADGGLIGVAQEMQARAAQVRPEARMGPVLLRPTGSRTSEVIVRGEPTGLSDALGYAERADHLRPIVMDALSGLRREHALIVLEGAGGAAEINLLERDLVNLPLAAATGIPAVLVVDIERGGAFAAAYGTWALLPPHYRNQLRGFIFNNFRGDPSLLDSGLRDLAERTGLAALGVLPHLDGPMPGAEDSLDLRSLLGTNGRQGRAGSTQPVRVAVACPPQLINPRELEPLLLEPDVVLRWVQSPQELSLDMIDLIVVPTFSDPAAHPLQWQTWLDALADDPAAPRVLRQREDGLGLHDDDFRAEILSQVAADRGRQFTAGAPYTEVLEAHLERLADWAQAHLDLAQLEELAATALPLDQVPGW